MEVFQKNGKSPDHFRHVFKSLKDQLLRDSFDQLVPELSAAKRRRMTCWSKFQRVNQLLIVEEKKAAIDLAVEVLNLSERCGFLEIEHSLLRSLEHHYGAIEPDTRRYLRYRRRLKDATKALLEEQQVLSLTTDLVFRIRRKKDWKILGPEIEEVGKKDNDRFMFNLFRYGLLTIWFRLNLDYGKLVETCQNAIFFFDNLPNDMPYVTKWTFYRQMIPVLVAQGRIQEADRYLTRCLTLPVAGTQNWHLALLQRAYLGFYSDKPRIAFDAWNRAMKNKKFNNLELDELWQTVHAYLAIYHKLGRLPMMKPFRLKKYLNSVSQTEQDKQGANVSITVAHLLHLLMDGKKKEYMKKAESISAYVHKHLRGKKHLRSRCILHMLAKVEDADYHRRRAGLRAQRWLRQLRKNPVQMVTESEIMPFEKVWEIALAHLK